MIHAVIWNVTFHEDFESEFATFTEEVQDELFATAAIVRKLGPEADRPHIGTLKNVKHPNMKELRFKANAGAEIWRAAFAFDPERNAVILVAADKQGVGERKFYQALLKKANQRFDRHLKHFKSVVPPKHRGSK